LKGDFAIRTIGREDYCESDCVEEEDCVAEGAVDEVVGFSE